MTFCRVVEEAGLKVSALEEGVSDSSGVGKVYPVPAPESEQVPSVLASRSQLQGRQTEEQ